MYTFSPSAVPAESVLPQILKWIIGLKHLSFNMLEQIFPFICNLAVKHLWGFRRSWYGLQRLLGSCLPATFDRLHVRHSLFSLFVSYLLSFLPLSLCLPHSVTVLFSSSPPSPPLLINFSHACDFPDPPYSLTSSASTCHVCLWLPLLALLFRICLPFCSSLFNVLCVLPALIPAFLAIAPVRLDARKNSPTPLISVIFILLVQLYFVMCPHYT